MPHILCLFQARSRIVPAYEDSNEQNISVLLDELRRYNPELLDKDILIAISKSDMLDEELKKEIRQELDKELKGINCLFISAVSQTGLTELKDQLWQLLNK